MTRKHSHKPAKPKLSRKRLAELDAAVDRVDDERADAVAWARQVRRRQAKLRDIAQALRDARQRKGLSLADVDALCGIGRGNLSRLETGRMPNPTLDTLLRLADALGVDLRVAVLDMDGGKARSRSDAA